MSRPLRIEYEGALYHVMNRGRGRRRIFCDDGFYADFLRCLEEVYTRFGAEIHAYCLMGNHYHLLIGTPRGNLSRIMRHIDGVYTQRHNRRKRTDGSLFRGRYKAILIDSSAYILQASRYIHRNPIELSRPLVDRLAAYSWSSYPAYINQTLCPKWLYRETVYGELSHPHRYSAYQRFVDKGNDQETQKLYGAKYLPSVWGDKIFKEEVYAHAVAMTKEVDQQGVRSVLSMKVIICAVAEYYGLATDVIINTARGRGAKNIPRWIAMKLCQERGSAKLTEIAAQFNVGHYSTVSQTIRRLNRLMAEDEELIAVFNIISQDLTP